ncbi:hypothetical protein VTK73DRAFT_7419 [Phialemonium thermophilum]|uniref:Uncharacterized protein n=1 Tax=Phialemonium thermophilum TaxID=223376 RepID=A0ABR3WEM9_9PEZI
MRWCLLRPREYEAGIGLTSLDLKDERSAEITRILLQPDKSQPTCLFAHLDGSGSPTRVCCICLPYLAVLEMVYLCMFLFFIFCASGTRVWKRYKVFSEP